MKNIKLQQEIQRLNDKIKQLELEKHTLSIETIITVLKWGNHMLLCLKNESTKNAYEELVKYALKYYRVEKLNKTY